MDLKFCPNCGAPIAANDDFCQNCGFNLKQYRTDHAASATPPTGNNISEQATKEPVHSAETPVNRDAVQAPPSTKKPVVRKKRHHRRWPWIVLAAIVVLVAGGYFAGSMYYSRGRQLPQLAKDMTSTDPKTMRKAAVDTDGTPLAASDLAPLAALYKAAPATQRTMKTTVADGRTNGAIKVTQSGRILGLFPRYKVILKTIKVPLTTNLSDTQITWNGNSVSSSKQGKTQQFIVYPGQYKVLVIGQLSGERNRLSKTVALSPFKTAETLAFTGKAAKTDDTLGSLLAKANSDSDKQAKKDADEAASESKKKAAESSSADSDADDSSDIDMDDLPNDPSARNDNADTNGLIGQWKQSDGSAFTFNSDGTYTGTANGKTDGGTYKVVYRVGDSLNIQFTKNGGSVVEPFAFVYGHLIETNLKLDWHRVN